MTISNKAQWLYKISIGPGLIFFIEEIGRAQEVFNANQKKTCLSKNITFIDETDRYNLHTCSHPTVI